MAIRSAYANKAMLGFTLKSWKCIERISGGILLLNSMVVAVQRAIRGLGGRKGTVWRA